MFAAYNIPLQSERSDCGMDRTPLYNPLPFGSKSNSPSKRHLQEPQVKHLPTHTKNHWGNMYQTFCRLPFPSVACFWLFFHLQCAALASPTRSKGHGNLMSRMATATVWHLPLAEMHFERQDALLNFSRFGSLGRLAAFDLNALNSNIFPFPNVCRFMTEHDQEWNSSPSCIDSSAPIRLHRYITTQLRIFRDVRSSDSGHQKSRSTQSISNVSACETFGTFVPQWQAAQPMSVILRASGTCRITTWRTHVSHVYSITHAQSPHVTNIFSCFVPASSLWRSRLWHKVTQRSNDLSRVEILRRWPFELDPTPTGEIHRICPGTTHRAARAVNQFLSFVL